MKPETKSAQVSFMGQLNSAACFLNRALAGLKTNDGTTNFDTRKFLNTFFSTYVPSLVDTAIHYEILLMVEGITRYNEPVKGTVVYTTGANFKPNQHPPVHGYKYIFEMAFKEGGGTTVTMTYDSSRDVFFGDGLTLKRTETIFAGTAPAK